MSDRTLRVLLAAQVAPPSPLIGARRVAALAKHLSAEGLEVAVLTSSISGEGEIVGTTRAIRTFDLMASPLNWRRAQFRALEGSSGGSYSRPSRLQSVLVPDIAAATWLPFAIPSLLRLSRRTPFDCVITTGPPHSVHLMGLALQRRGASWIAEFRDGWTFEQPTRVFPWKLQRRLDAWLESSIAAKADAVVGVTEPIAEDLRTRFGRPATVLTNGFDPDELTSERHVDILDPKRFSIVHTGRLAYSGRSPKPLFDALRLLRRERPEVVTQVELVFAGPLTSEEQALFDAEDLRGLVRAVGTLDWREALALQRAADGLLVITDGMTRPATGKLFEYLAADAPILVLGEQTEAARIVGETAAGFAASATDPPLIATALELLVSSSVRGRDQSAVEAYSYPNIARSYARLIRDVVGARS